MTYELTPWQAEGARRLRLRQRYMLAWSPGLGKTRPVVERRGELPPDLQTLWVVPSNVRKHIAREFGLWAPQLESKLWVHEDGTEPIPADKSIVITSYELATAIDKKTGLPKLPKRNWQYTVYDECHYLKDWKSKRTQQAREIAKRSQYLYMLSGTPIANEPSDIYTQVDMLFPWKFGSYSDFAHRYCIVEPNDYSPLGKVYGLNPANADEFRHKISLVSHRVTKDEVAHLLPKLTVTPRYIKPTKRKNLTMTEALESIQTAAASRKVDATMDLVAEHAGDQKICLLTHLNVTAERLYAACREAYPEWRIWLVPEGNRDAVLQEAAAYEGPAIIVSTYHKVGIGISNLTWPKVVVFTELDWQPAAISQALGRFNRLNSEHPVQVYFVIMEGTAEEAVSRVLLRKMQSAAAIMKAGSEENLSIQALDSVCNDDVLNELFKAAENSRDIDEEIDDG
jgi:SNF2 family DNA or RNA helicase